MPAVAVSKNSTIVRTMPFAARAVKQALRILSPRAPELAARYAERVFLTPSRHRRPAWEEEILATARRFRIPHDGAMLPAWEWSSRGPGTAGAGAALGPRPTVLLVHGWEGRGSQLGAFVEPLVAKGFRVVTFDGPGHGDASTRTASVVDQARAVASVSHHLGHLHAAIGHSVGGAALLLGTRFGFRADRLALVSPPVSPRRFAAGFARMFELTDAVEKSLLERLESRYGVSMAELDARPYAARTSAPMLVVHDKDDRIVGHLDGEAIAAAAPDARLVTTTGLGHHRILRAPNVVAEVVPFVTGGLREDASFAATIDGELYHRDERW